MRVAITNIGTIVSGDWRAPLVQGDTMITLGAEIESVGLVRASGSGRFAREQPFGPLFRM